MNHLPITHIAFIVLTIAIVCYRIGLGIRKLIRDHNIYKKFSNYLSVSSIAKLQRDPTLLKSDGDTIELTILFIDMYGFDNIHEYYGKNAYEITKLMNRYMSLMSKIVLENNGTLNKHVGHSHMAFWNAPIPNSHHAKDAVKTALQMTKALEKFNATIFKEGIPAFSMGIGINTDTVIVGDMGRGRRFNYTCMGDGVDTASTFEGQTRTYGVKIIIGPKTAELVKDEYQVVDLDIIQTNDNKEPINIYTVLEKVDEKSEIAHNKFLEAYRNGEFGRAYSMASAMTYVWQGNLKDYYKMMSQRIKKMLLNKLTNWDGVYRLGKNKFDY